MDVAHAYTIVAKLAALCTPSAVHELSKPTSCAKLPKGSKSGTYTLATAVGEVKTYCDMDTDGAAGRFWPTSTTQRTTANQALWVLSRVCTESAWRL